MNLYDESCSQKSYIHTHTYAKEGKPLSEAVVFVKPHLNPQGKHISPFTENTLSVFHTVQTFNSCTSRPDVYQCLVVRTLVDNNSKNEGSTSMTHIAFETKLCSVVKSHMHPCPGNCVATGHAVVNYAQAARSFSAGIKCRHCT